MYTKLHQDCSDFIQTINSLEIHLGNTMVTSTVVSLFTDVPFRETMSILPQQFSRHNQPPPPTVHINLFYFIFIRTTEQL
jgi:hypothetical protein